MTTVLSDKFNSNSGGVPANWTQIFDPNGSIIERNDLTITDATGNTAGIASQTTYNPAGFLSVLITRGIAAQRVEQPPCKRSAIEQLPFEVVEPRGVDGYPELQLCTSMPGSKGRPLHQFAVSPDTSCRDVRATGQFLDLGYWLT